MAKERESEVQSGIPLTGIYIDLPSKTVVFAAKNEVVASIRLASEGLIFQSGQTQSDIPQAPSAEALPLVQVPQSVPAEASETEKPKIVTLQGKLKSKPREGRPDSRGNATAWARFAAHEADQDSAHMYSATFHKHTAKIALGLDNDMPLTVQGYPHEHDDPGSKRMDTLSVINLLDYPGKPTGK